MYACVYDGKDRKRRRRRERDGQRATETDGATGTSTQGTSGGLYRGMSARLRKKDDDVVVVVAGDDGGCCCSSGWMVVVVWWWWCRVVHVVCWADLVEEGGLKQGSGSSGPGWSRVSGWSGYQGVSGLDAGSQGREGAPCAHQSASYCCSICRPSGFGPQTLAGPLALGSRRAHAGSQSQLTPGGLPTLQPGTWELATWGPGAGSRGLQVATADGG